jgi:hypothetical protein
VTEAEIRAAIQAGTFEGEASIPVSVYDDDGLYARNTWLTEILKSPAHCLNAIKNFDSKKTPAMIFGQALHVRLLEPALYPLKVAVKPDADGRTNLGKQRLLEFKSEHAGKIHISQEDSHTIEQIAFRVLANENARKLLSDGKPEHSLFWKDERTGVRCKARCDYARFDADAIIDVKTTENASLRAFEKSIYNFGYHRQAAYYLSGASKVVGRPITSFIFVAIEKEPPFALALYRLQDAAVERGRLEIDQALDRLAECQKTGAWPAYPEEIQDIALPSFAW